KDGLVVTNKGKRAIIGLATKWYVTDKGGNVRVRPFRSHSFLAPGFEPLANANERIIVLPGMFIQERKLQSVGIIVSSPAQSTITLFSGAESVNIQIDSIIFDDGEVVGPNTLHLNAEIRAAKDASDIVARHVRTSVAMHLKTNADPRGDSPDAKQIQAFVNKIDG